MESLIYPMNCNCHVLYDQDCKDPGHEENMRRVRTAVFDYMKCLEIEAEEGWNNDELE